MECSGKKMALMHRVAHSAACRGLICFAHARMYWEDTRDRELT